MPSNYPTSVDAQITNPTSSTREDVLSHAAQHTNENDQIHAIQTALGPTGTPGPVLTALAAGSVTGPPAFGATAVVGTSNQLARQDHIHGLPANPVNISGTPAAVGQANATGSSGTLVNSDHVHQGVTSVTAGTGISVSGGDGSGHGAITIAATASGGLTLIQRVVAGAAQTNFTLSSIPGTYEDLMIHVMGRFTDSAIAQNVQVQFNGDTGANYHYQAVFGSGSTTSSSAAAGNTSLFVAEFSAATGTANYAGSCRLVIPSYARTVFNKTVTGQGGVFWGASAADSQLAMTFGEWASTAAITSVTLFGAGGLAWTQGSVVSLYGVS